MRFSKDEELNISRELFRSQPAFDVGHMTKYIDRIAVAACPCAHENHAPNKVRVPQRQLLRDRAAHRAAHDTRSPNAQRREQPGGIVGHLFGGVRPNRFIAQSHPAMVREDAAELLCPILRMLLPYGPARRDSHQEEDRIALTKLFVI